MSAKKDFPKDPAGLYGVRLCVNGTFEDPFTFKDFSVRERWFNKIAEAQKDSQTRFALLHFCGRLAGDVEIHATQPHQTQTQNQIFWSAYLGQSISDTGLSSRPSLDEVRRELRGIWELDAWMDTAEANGPRAMLTVISGPKQGMH